MKKDILVTVSGLQFIGGEDCGPVEMITMGSYFKKNGKHYVLYDEVMEGFEGVTKSVIKLGEDFMEVTKRGGANLHMLFERNKKNVSYYYTPLGSLFIGVDTKEICLVESEDEIDVKVRYRMEMNYEYLADCCIYVNIKSKETGVLHL